MGIKIESHINMPNKTSEKMSENPYDTFKEWLKEAEKTELNDPNAMCLATATPDGVPSARIVLLKGINEHGFVFYTNGESRKGKELKNNNHVALCFHWKSLLRQVRIEGIIEEVSEQEADAYYNTRHRGSRIGAWASKQSQPLASRQELKDFVESYETKFKDSENIPRPPYWKGYRVKPTKIEFWIDGEYRLHERYVYTKDNNDNWITNMIYP